MTENSPAPDERILRLNAALDGELDAANLLQLEREMLVDPALAAQYRLLASTREAIQRHAPREAAPRALVERIAALGAPVAPTATAPPAAARRPRRSAWGVWNARSAMSLAASAAVLGFAIGAGVATLRAPGVSHDKASGLVSDFTRAAVSGQPYDVASSDRHTVKPWLASRTTVSASIVDLAAQGFPLAGGRVAIVDRIPVPTLVYRHGEHLIAVTELPPGRPGARAGAPIETIDGYHVVRWSDASLSYVAVSDIDENELAAFVEVFRQARNPGREGTGQ